MNAAEILKRVEELDVERLALLSEGKYAEADAKSREAWRLLQQL